MTTQQRASIWLAVALVVGTSLFPPWMSVREVPATYQWLFAPPASNTLAAKLDLSRLFVEWIIGLAISAGFYFAWSTPTKNQLKWVAISFVGVTMVFLGTAVAIGYFSDHIAKKDWFGVSFMAVVLLISGWRTFRRG